MKEYNEEELENNEAENNETENSETNPNQGAWTYAKYATDYTYQGLEGGFRNVRRFMKQQMDSKIAEDDPEREHKLNRNKVSFPKFTSPKAGFAIWLMGEKGLSAEEALSFDVDTPGTGDYLSEYLYFLANHSVVRNSESNPVTIDFNNSELPEKSADESNAIPRMYAKAFKKFNVVNTNDYPLDNPETLQKNLEFLAMYTAVAKEFINYNDTALRNDSPYDYNQNTDDMEIYDVDAMSEYNYERDRKSNKGKYESPIDAYYKECYNIDSPSYEDKKTQNEQMAFIAEQLEAFENKLEELYGGPSPRIPTNDEETKEAQDEKQGDEIEETQDEKQAEENEEEIESKPEEDINEVEGENLSNENKEPESEIKEEAPAQENNTEEKENDLESSSDLLSGFENIDASSLEDLDIIQTAKEHVTKAQAAIKQNGPDLELVAAVLGTRFLTNAKKGKSDFLKKNVSEKELNEVKERITKDDSIFKAYYDECMKTPEGKSKLKNAALKGNGDELESKIRKYANTLSLSKLASFSQDEANSRFVPTVRQRIESLQNIPDEKMTGKEKTIVAEIIALRKVCGAERGNKYSLDKPLTPAMAAEVMRQKKLLMQGKDFETLMEDIGYTKPKTVVTELDNDKVISHEDKEVAKQVRAFHKLIKTGHGGLLSDKLENKAFEDIAYASSPMNEVLWPGTIKSKEQNISNRFRDMNKSIKEMEVKIVENEMTKDELKQYVNQTSSRLVAESVVISKMRSEAVKADGIGANYKKPFNEEAFETQVNSLMNSPEFEKNYKAMMGDPAKLPKTANPGEIAKRYHDAGKAPRHMDASKNANKDAIKSGPKA